MGNAYVGFSLPDACQQAYFVTRARKKMKYEVVGTNDNFNDLVGIVGNLIIHLSGYVSEKKYTEGLRLAKIFDA